VNQGSEPNTHSTGWLMLAADKSLCFLSKAKQDSPPLTYLSSLGDCVTIPLCHWERPKGACLHAEVPASYVTLLTDSVTARRRGNPTKPLRGQSPWQSHEFLRFAQDKASVVSLPRNDIMTQSLEGEGRVGGM
jgi:hypothetical protein